MECKLSIIGRVGRDSELRYLKDGKAVCNYSVATNPNPKDKEKTIWVRVSSWGKRAEIDGQYVKKGMLIKVEGALQTDENGGPRVWTDTEGNARASYEMMAFDTKYLTWPANFEETVQSELEEFAFDETEEIPF